MAPEPKAHPRAGPRTSRQSHAGPGGRPKPPRRQAHRQPVQCPAAYQGGRTGRRRASRATALRPASRRPPSPSPQGPSHSRCCPGRPGDDPSSTQASLRPPPLKTRDPRHMYADRPGPHVSSPTRDCSVAILGAPPSREQACGTQRSPDKREPGFLGGNPPSPAGSPHLAGALVVPQPRPHSGRTSAERHTTSTTS